MADEVQEIHNVNAFNCPADGLHTDSATLDVTESENLCDSVVGASFKRKSRKQSKNSESWKKNEVNKNQAIRTSIHLQKQNPSANAQIATRFR